MVTCRIAKFSSLAFFSFFIAIELQQLQDVLQIAEPNSHPTTMIQLGDNPDYRPFLKGIKMSTDNCLILHCSVDKVLSVLQQANELKMLGEYQVHSSNELL